MEKSLIQHLSCKTGTPLLQLTEWVEDWEEKNFVWSDELVIAFMDYFKNDFSKGFPKYKAMDYFKNSKQSKQPEELFEVKLTKSELNKLMQLIK